MSDKHYPTVDADFVHSCMAGCDKIESDVIHVGRTSAYTVRGTSAINKRLVVIRELPTRQINYLNATALAARFGFMGLLLDWLKENRSWIDGGYSAETPSSPTE